MYICQNHKSLKDMNHIRNFITIVFSILIGIPIYSQSDCKVVVKDLQGIYNGDCRKGLADGEGSAKGKDTYTGEWKKGLPNGHGKYTWSTGEIYEGEWRKGQKNGYGIYQFKYKNKDTIVEGVWQNDIYEGKPTQAPEVIQQYNIDKYQINNVNAFQNRVIFDFWQNGARNTSMEDLKLIATSGTIATSGQLTGFDNISFPVTITIRYTSYNKLHTSKFNAVFEITVFEPGDYEVKLFN